MLIRVLVVAVIALALCACGASKRGPNLIELREISPAHAEAGDRLRIAGSGFPEGRAARVVLRGELFRAGEPVQSGVEIRANAELSSPHALDVVLGPELTAELCGKTDARHTTFRGDLEVTFAPRTRTGTPIGGVLEGVVLDVSPDHAAEATSSALRGEGERFAKYLGVKFTRSDAGLVVAEVQEKSRASRAGILPGDLVTDLDGMVVRDLRDWVPAPNTRTAVVQVERAGERIVLRAESAGFRYHSPSALSGAVLLLGLVLAPLVSLWSPLGRWLVYLEQRVAERLRASRPRHAEGERASRLVAVLAGMLQKLPASPLPYFGVVATSALFTLLALGKTVVSAELDLFLVPASVSVGLLVAALASGGGGGRWSIQGGLRRAAGAMLLTLPPLMALLTAALSEDSIELRRLVDAQGAFPWQWSIFRSPVALASVLVAIAALVPSVRAAVRSDRPLAAGDRLLGLAEWTHKLVLSGALAVAFFGGWQLGNGSDSVVWSAAGALGLLVKSWALLGLVAFLRWALGTLDVVVSLGAAARWLVLPSAMCALVTLGFRQLVSRPELVPLHAEAGKVLFAAALVLLFGLIFRVLRGVRAEGPELGIQFWL